MKGAGARIALLIGVAVLAALAATRLLRPGYRDGARDAASIELVVEAPAPRPEPGSGSPAWAGAGPARPARWPRAPNIVLISVDTLRADHLGAYGYARDVSPAIDSLAEDGVLFERAFVAIPKTTPSLVSLLSGLQPKTHGVQRLKIPVSNAVPLLAQVLSDHGYATAGFCGQFNCSRRWGFDRGFQHFDDRFEFDVGQESVLVGGGFYPTSEKRAGYLVDEAMAWIEVREGDPRPFFVWLHLMDPHAGYAPPPPYPERFQGASAFSAHAFHGAAVPVEMIHSQARVEGVVSYEDYVNRYDAEIRYLDDQLRRLFGFLRTTGLYREAVILLTADHGEYMGEADAGIFYFSHGSSLFESEIRIPLLFKPPQAGAKPIRSDRLVSIVDVAPTILWSAGIQAPPADGTNLLAGVLDRHQPASRQEIFVQRPGSNGVFAVRTERYKLVVTTELTTGDAIRRLQRGERVPGTYRVYDLRADPLEREGQPRGHRSIAADLSRRLARWLVEPRVLDIGPQEPEALDDATLRHLRLLGYAE
jgi:arylsulfatase A-like enzyme